MMQLDINTLSATVPHQFGFCRGYTFEPDLPPPPRRPPAAALSMSAPLHYAENSLAVPIFQTQT